MDSALGLALDSRFAHDQEERHGHHGFSRFWRTSRSLDAIAHWPCFLQSSARRASFSTSSARRGRAIEVQSGKLLSAFLQRDTSKVSTAPGVSIRLQNVRFKWSNQVYVDASDMALRAEPIQGSAVKFDDPSSFVLTLQQSSVMVRPEVLQGMMNESIFNYPGSKLRDLKVKLVQEDNDYPIEITGKMRMGIWITFQMLSHLSVDQKTNTLVMGADRVKVLGFLPATQMIQMPPFHLEKLITMPPNQSMIVTGNRIMVKPFGLFPPPGSTARSPRSRRTPTASA